jgi:hypothetical protein
MPALRVARQLFDAASKVRDGEIVQAPVAENDRFAIVWRRGSRPEQREALQDVTPLIRERLLETALASGARELLERLRREGLREQHPEIVSSFEPPPEPEVSRASRLAPPLPLRPVQLRPEPGDYGLR